MSENQGLEYYDIVEALQRASTGADASDCHGFLCGLTCAAGYADQKVWIPQVFESYDPKDALQAEAFRLLQELYEYSATRLNSPDLDFRLLLPDDEDPLRDRTEALGHWCAGFLSGLGIGGLPPQDRLPEEVGEFLQDVAQISRVDFELDNPDEEDQRAFEELVEYIRVGVLLIHDELQPGIAPQQVQ